MNRQIVLDTETTGLDPNNGEKIVEIGAIELKNSIPTKNFFHVYLNPEKVMPLSAFKVHGLSNDFLKDKPLFEEIADEFLNFISEDQLIIHNANFDVNFLNYELKKVNKKLINFNRVIDTLEISKNKFPGTKVSLDALTRKFNITEFDRSLHGALLDCKILSKIYLELIGGKQPDLIFSNPDNEKKFKNENKLINLINNNKRVFNLTEEERENHKKFIKKFRTKYSWKL